MLLTLSMVIFYFQACSDDDCNNSQPSPQQEMLHLKGAVLDSTVEDAFIHFLKTDRDIIATGESDSHSTYEISIPESTDFPLHIEVISGKDYLSRDPLPVSLTSYALNYYQETANITPLTHLIRLISMAREKTNILTKEMIDHSIYPVLKNFGFTLSTEINPITMDISGDNAADVLISSQLVSELIKIIGGRKQEDRNMLCNIWAEDLVDDKLDGKQYDQMITRELSNGVNGIKVCMLTHLYRIIYSCDLISHSFVMFKNDGVTHIHNSKGRLINSLAILYNASLSPDEAEKKLNALKLSSVFTVELINSMNMIKKFKKEDLPTVYQTFSDALDDVQDGDYSSVNSALAVALRNESLSVANEIQDTSTSILEDIIHNPLIAITIIYPYQSVQENSSFKLLVSGKYKDGTTTDLSNKVKWSLTNSSVINYDNNFIAAKSGEVTIYAEYENITDDITLEIVPYHPSVVSHEPAVNSENVNPDTVIIIKFSKNIAPDSVTTNHPITIQSQSENIPYTISTSGTDISLTPTVTLDENSTYIVTVTTDLRDEGGNPLQENYTWSFKTANILPFITSKSPEDGITNVSLESPITVTFSEPIDYTYTGTIFKVLSDSTDITGNLNWKSDSVAVFEASNNWRRETAYTVTVYVKDFAGNLMKKMTRWNFFTESENPEVLSHYPVSDQKDVSISSSITVTFSEPIHIANDYIELISNDGVSITGTIAYSQSDHISNCQNCSVMYTPSILLSENTRYIAMITTKFTDETNHSLASPYSWTFTTQKSPEIVSKTDFLNSKEDVHITNANEKDAIFFTFSEPMALSSYTLTIRTENQVYTLTVQSNDDCVTKYILSESFLFTESTNYTLTLSDHPADKNGYPLEGDNLSWFFHTRGIPPTITQTLPDNDSKIDKNIQIIEVFFSENIQESQFESELMSVYNGTTKLTGSKPIIANNKLSYALKDHLTQDTQYTVTIFADKIEDLKGNHPEQNYTFSFSTKNDLPEILDYYPKNNTTVTSTNTIIRLTCSEVVKNMNEAFFKIENSSKKLIDGNFSTIGNQVFYTPMTLDSGMEYTVTIGKNFIEDSSSAPNEYTTQWNFSTYLNSLDYTYTANYESIVLTFTSEMDPKSFTKTSFYLSNHKAIVPSNIIIGDFNNIFVLKPEKALPGGIRYTVTMTSDIKTINGKSLQHNKYEHFSLINSPYTSMKFKYIPEGSFLMGSPIDELGRDKDENQHTVKISRPFQMQTTEVTISQWEAIMGYNPSGYSDPDPNLPVVNVSWNDVQTFIRKLNENEDDQNVYKLPTEAQWEYAARAATKNAFSNGKDLTEIKYSCDQDDIINDIAVYCHNSNAKTHIVKQKQANNWELYDMSGNVMEWTADYYLAHYQAEEEEVVDPTGPKSGSFRVIRGGSFADSAKNCRSANRGWLEPDLRMRSLGFRLIIEIE